MTNPTIWALRPANTLISLGFDLSLQCLHKENKGPQLPKESTVQTVTRLGECKAKSLVLSHSASYSMACCD